MSSGGGVVSLVRFLGDERIKFQPLRNAITDIKTRGKESKVTFATEDTNINATNIMTGKGGKIGLILWIDEKDYLEWYNKGSEENKG